MFLEYFYLILTNNQFKNFTNVSIDLKSPSHAVDLLLYLEGITSLLVTPHHFYNSSATWPFLLEESGKFRPVIT